MLSDEQIAERRLKRRPFEDVEVAEWGLEADGSPGKVRVHKSSAGARARFWDELRRGRVPEDKGWKPTLEAGCRAQCLLLEGGLLNAKGEQRFTADELEDDDPDVIDRLYDVCVRLTGLSPEEGKAEAAGK